MPLFGTVEQQLHAQADAEQRHLQVAQRLDQSLRMQARHAVRGGADAGQDHPTDALQPLRIAHQAHLHAQPLQRIADRAKVGPTRIDQRNLRHSAPLVLGNAVPWRGKAWRSARASALKQASTLWWSLSPRTLRCRLSPAASHS